MAITKEPEINKSKKPILLKGTRQALCLQLRIGGLEMEFLDFPNSIRSKPPRPVASLPGR